MHKPEQTVGKTALYFEKDRVPHTIRVMVVKWLGDNNYVVSEFDNPSKSYKVDGWNFTIEKDEDQPTMPLLEKFLEAYEINR
jgi:hypothetical protein